MTSANRTLHQTRTFPVSLDALWKASTESTQIVNWWGPDGFTCTIHTMDFRKGGEWKLTLHGPNGTKYPNRSVYLEIIPHEKIVFEHFNPHFLTTVLFQSMDQGTVVDWSMEFDTPEMFDVVVKAHKADEGLVQNLDKLGKFLMQ
ncbi:MAG TPA: SRPBCC domain-containing protein [Cyclobacteriaceae bacterium]|nr:SRPBCC domain-containing protein [Cyclobacteriaceae bacterium]